MTKQIICVLLLASFGPVACSRQSHRNAGPGPQAPQGDLAADHRSGPPRNIILFVADGLRPGVVNPADTPAFAKVSSIGVRFANSHSLFPTFTTANASALATGHYLGDTADFSNTIYTGYRLFAGGFLAAKPLGSFTPFLENDETLADVNMHVSGNNYLDEESLLSLARRNGFNTAAIGKVGPVMIQDVSLAKPTNGQLSITDTIIIDDTTGKSGGVPLTPALVTQLAAAQVGAVAPGRDNHAPGTQTDNGNSGSLQKPGTLAANLVQQQFFVDAATKVVIPAFAADRKPFILVFWSRDPDGSQHNQGDSLGKLVPGINGPTSKAGIQNADANLQSLMAAVAADPRLAGNTDIIVTADHGFSTISHRNLDAAAKTMTQAYPATLTYKDAHGKPLVEAGSLPPGFLAIDLAHGLDLPLYDPDTALTNTFAAVDPTGITPGSVILPKSGNGLIGGNGSLLNQNDVKVIVAANGGSDLVYLPGGDAALLKKVVSFLAKQDYVSGLFTDDAFGDIPGALPLSAINLKGKALLPTPSLVVNFRTFATNPADPLTTQVELADTGLQQGQGMHGSFGRGDTYNFMAAYGPDFKAGFVDAAPVSNADLPLTIAHILGLELPSVGSLRGRIATEALVGNQPSPEFKVATLHSAPDEASGEVTVLNYQEAGGIRYFDAAGFPGRTNGLTP